MLVKLFRKIKNLQIYLYLYLLGKSKINEMGVNVARIQSDYQTYPRQR
jgi:hypothetical protein